MSPRPFRDMVIFGLDVLASAIDTTTNVIAMVLGDAATGTAWSRGVEFWQPPGYAGVPADPTPGKPSAQVLGFRQGDRDVVFAVRDNRFAARYANLKPGEVCVFSTSGAGRVLMKKDGTVTLYTTDSNEDGGKAVFFQIDPQNGMRFVAPWGSFVFDQTGWHVRHAGGFRLDAGPVGGLPAPFSALGSYFTVLASVCKTQGSLVLLGPGPDYNPVVWGPAENPLTAPGVPLTAIGFGAPLGLFTASCVRISGLPGVG